MRGPNVKLTPIEMIVIIVITIVIGVCYAYWRY